MAIAKNSLERLAMKLTHTPFVPAKAGIQGGTLVFTILGHRFHGDERRLAQASRK
jgi:hypothetical protein